MSKKTPKNVRAHTDDEGRLGRKEYEKDWASCTASWSGCRSGCRKPVRRW
jgi:hypothetical protein